MLAGGPFGLGPLELGVIVIVLLLVFGVGKVGDLGGALGKSVREFRRNVHDDDAPASTESTNNSSSGSTAASPQVTAARFCTNCGAQVDGEAKFCAKCGTPAQATVS
jgi:sec-independent protein translocase protein TatA